MRERERGREKGREGERGRGVKDRKRERERERERERFSLQDKCLFTTLLMVSFRMIWIMLLNSCSNLRVRGSNGLVF